MFKKIKLGKLQEELEAKIDNKTVSPYEQLASDLIHFIFRRNGGSYDISYRTFKYARWEYVRLILLDGFELAEDILCKYFEEELNVNYKYLTFDRHDELYENEKKKTKEIK